MHTAVDGRRAAPTRRLLVRPGPVTTVSRFRMFGRPQTRPVDGPDPWLDDPAPVARPIPSDGTPHPSLLDPPLPDPSGRGPSGWSSANATPGAGPSADVVADPATRAALPAVWTPRRPEPDAHRSPESDPVTDPFGFPPVPPVVGPTTAPAPEPAAWAPVAGPTTTPAPEPAAWAGWRPTPAPDAPRAEPVSSAGTGVSGPAAGWGAAAPGNAWAAWSVPVTAEPAAPAASGWGTNASTAPPGAPPSAPNAAPPTPSAAAPNATPATPGAALSLSSAAPAAGGRLDPIPAPPADVEPSAKAATPAPGPIRPIKPAPSVPTSPAPAPALPSPRTGHDGVDGPAAPDPAEASALAAAFAADYLSWDEDDPGRRGGCLAGYLPGPRADRALLGWSGQGRQRTEMVLPGRVRPDGDGRVLVDVRVRVTPYRRVENRGPTRPEAEPDDPFGEPAAAPPATARGWRGLASRWVRLGVSITVEDGELVVDAGEETLQATPDERPAPAPTPPTHPDLTVDGDDDPPSPRSIAALRGGAR